MVCRLFALVLVAAAFLAVPAAAAPAGLSEAQIAAIRAAMSEKLAADSIPGAAIAIGLGEDRVWSEGFGLADVEHGVRATAETVFRTASIGKPLTATAAMVLAQAGRLDLDAPVQRYCPRFPEKPWPVTARQLLNHTAGIRHYLPASEEAETYLTRHYDDAISPLAIFADDPLQFQPGQGYLYSTWGYVLLGCVIEGAAGEPYLAYMRRALFEPAGMTATRDDDPRAIIPHRARGYVLRGGRIENSRFADLSGKMGAGGFVTSAADLARFGLAFAGDRLVSAATRERMLTETSYGNGDSVNYGYGWLINEHRGLRYVAHGGGTPQVSAFLIVVPERRISIALMFNLEGTPDREPFARRILDIVLGP